MSGDGRDEPVGGGSGGAGDTDGEAEAGGQAARHVPSQGGPVGAAGPLGPPGVPGTGGAGRSAGSLVPGPASEPDPADVASPGQDTSVPPQREGRGGFAPTAPLPTVPAPTQRPGVRPPGDSAPRHGVSGAAAGTPTAPGRPTTDPSPRDAESGLPPSDVELVRRMRDGDDGAYEELFRRHADPVRRYARSCCRDAHTADDLTAEVFARTLQAVRRGAGPEQAVRAYLMTTVRRVAASWTRSARREHLVEDFAVFAAQAAVSATAPDEVTLELGADVKAMHRAEQTLAVRAFRSLPERWQAVLWHTTVEDESPSQVAPLFGLTPNATAVLAGRAREGLKQAYLQAHVNSALTAGGDCARYADRLGAHARGGLRTRAERGLRKHLEECGTCRLAAGELATVNAQIPAVVPIAVIGWFATGFSLKAAGLVGGAAAGAGAAAGGAAGAASGGSAGGAAAEGLGAPLKIAAASAAVVAAAAGLVWALTSGADRPAIRSDAKPPAAQQLVPQIPVPSSKPGGPPAPSRVVSPRAHLPSPSTTPPAHSPAPPRHASPQSHVSPPPPARSTPTRPSDPAPPSPTPPRTVAPPVAPPAPPAPADFPVNRLGYGLLGDGTRPELRIGAVGWIWQRHGLSVGGAHFGSGVSMHAPGSVTIDLNRPCSRYRATVGLDDVTHDLGAVRFAVYGDSGPLWTSPVLRGGGPPLPVSVGIAGQRTIRLIVEPQTAFGLVAVADWAEARVSCG